MDLDSLQCWEDNFSFPSRFSVQESGLCSWWQGSFFSWPKSSVGFVGWQRTPVGLRLSASSPLVFTSSFEPGWLSFCNQQVKHWSILASNKGDGLLPWSPVRRVVLLENKASVPLAFISLPLDSLTHFLLHFSQLYCVYSLPTLSV